MQPEIGVITSKGQTTIPASLRRELKLEAGDKVLFQKEGNAITLRKLPALDADYYRMIEAIAAPEWNSPEDEEAFRDL